MKNVTVHEFQRDVISWLNRVKNGETLVILEESKPFAEITPVNSDSENLRPYGLCAGEFVVPEDFNEPLPDEITQLFSS